jgi:leucyl aminopeptidase (aminopeptidase T)
MESKFFPGSSEVVIKTEKEISPELVANAKKTLEEFLGLKPEERLLFLTDKSTNPDFLTVLKKAVDEIKCASEEKKIAGKIKKAEYEQLMSDKTLVFDLAENSEKMTERFYDDLEEDCSYRLVNMWGLGPDSFEKEGAMTEPLTELEKRLGKMEALLKEVAGFKITSSYGTNLEAPLRPFNERRWYKDSGVVKESGEWDNLPGGEIFTTPDERFVNGLLVVPAIDSQIAKEQGVDEFVRITIRNGKISSILGGRSAEILRKRMAEEAKAQAKEGEDPLNVFQIAEIAFGANSKARSTVKDPEQPYNFPGVSVVEAEKRFGTMHLAFGSSKHGNEGTEGFEDAVSHFDFVIPRNGLTVETFSSERDWQKKSNGRKIISEGGINFF